MEQHRHVLGKYIRPGTKAHNPAIKKPQLSTARVVSGLLVKFGNTSVYCTYSMWSFNDFHDVPHLHRVLKGKKKRWMISKSTYKFCKVNNSEEATKPSNEINDLNTWSLEADDTPAFGKVFYTCIWHGSYKGAGLKNSERWYFCQLFHS